MNKIPYVTREKAEEIAAQYPTPFYLYDEKGKKVKVITYDAWKYANDSFRRMFLLKIQEELKYEQTEEMQRFY